MKIYRFLSLSISLFRIQKVSGSELSLKKLLGPFAHTLSWKTGTPTIIEKATVSRSELNEMNHES